MVRDIVINFKNARYRLMKLELRNDDSFYCYFPQKNRYYVKNWTEVKHLRGTTQIKLKENRHTIKEKMYNPHISFHSGKMIIHATAYNNLGKSVKLIPDSEKIDPVELLVKPIHRPLFSVLMPARISILDNYQKEAEHIEFINTDEALPTILNFDFLLHSKDKLIDKNSFKGILKIVIFPLVIKPFCISMVVRTVNRLGGINKEIVSEVGMGKVKDPIFFTLNPLISKKDR